MGAERAKLFKHGGSQAVRLPKDFRFEGSEVTIRRDGDAVILEPVKTPTKEDMQALWDRIDALRGDEPFLERLPQPPLEDPKFDW